MITGAQLDLKPFQLVLLLASLILFVAGALELQQAVQPVTSLRIALAAVAALLFLSVQFGSSQPWFHPVAWLWVGAMVLFSCKKTYLGYANNLHIPFESVFFISLFTWIFLKRSATLLLTFIFILLFVLAAFSGSIVIDYGAIIWVLQGVLVIACSGLARYYWQGYREVIDAFEKLRSDLTLEMKIKGNQLQQSDFLFRAVFESAQEAVLLIDPTRHIITDCNQKGLQLFEAAQKERLIGEPVSLLDTDQQGLPVFYQLPRQHTGLVWQGLVRLKSLSGNLIWGNVHLHFIHHPQHACFLLSVSDVSSQIAIQQKLEQVNERYRAALSQNRDCLWEYDHEASKFFFSTRWKAMLGYQEEEIGQELTLLSWLVHPEDFQKAQPVLQGLLSSTQDSYELEVRMLHKNQTWRWIRHMGVALRSKDGYLNRIVGSSTNVTDLREVEEKLIRQNAEIKKMKDELDRFVYRSSHDLRAPLASINGLIHLARQENEPGKTQHYLDLISKCVTKLDYLTQEIIDLSSNARLEIKNDSIVLSELIEEVFADLRYYEFADKIDISFKVHNHSGVQLRTDRQRLKLIFTNLVANAIRYHLQTRKDPFVKVTARILPEKLLVDVSDNGQGIASVHLPHVFDMFYRANQRISGSGLGLYIVRETITKLNGKVQVLSEYGVGTTVSFEVPNMHAPLGQRKVQLSIFQEETPATEITKD